MSHHPFHLRSYEQRVYEVPCKSRANQVFRSQHPPPPAPLVWVVHVIPCITAAIHAWSPPTSTAVLAFARRHGHPVLVCMLPSFNLPCECFAFDLGQQPTLQSMPPSASSHNRPSEMSSSSSAEGPSSSLCSRRRRRKDCIPTYAHTHVCQTQIPSTSPRKHARVKSAGVTTPFMQNIRQVLFTLHCRHHPSHAPCTPHCKRTFQDSSSCVQMTKDGTKSPLMNIQKVFILRMVAHGSAGVKAECVCVMDQAAAPFPHPSCQVTYSRQQPLSHTPPAKLHRAGSSPFPPPLLPSYIQQAARLGNKGRQTRLHPPVGNQSLR
jgi:hypothetical protein